MTGEGRRDVVPPLRFGASRFGASRVAADRLFGVDAARGLALLGMFVAHTVYAPGELVVEGRSSILFATVAGVSLGLVSGGAHPTPPGGRGVVRLSVATRGAALVLLGLALTAFLRPPIAVILDYYGLGFLLLVAPLFLARRWLVAAAVVLALVGPVLVSAAEAATESAGLALPVALVAEWLVLGFYPLVVWLVFLLAGLVLARSDLRDRSTAAIALVGGAFAAVVGYGAALLVPGVDASAHSGTTAEVVASGGVALAVIGALSLLDSATGVGESVARVVRFVLAPLAGAGAMALTLYVAHAIVLAVARDAAGGSPRWSPPDGILPALVIGALVIGPLWRRLLGPGPLEAGLRALTRLVTRASTRPRVAP